MNRFGYTLKYILPVSAASALLFVPLLGDFHFESAALAALAGSFWAAFAFLNGSYAEEKARLAGILKVLALFAVPFFIKALVTGCLDVHGAGFWLLTPVPAVFLGAALGRALRVSRFRYKKTLLLGVMLSGAAGVLLIELKTLPQIYFFNHFWGYFPGPVYDETVRITKSYLYFRMLTVLWILLLWNLPLLTAKRSRKALVLISAAGLVFGYLNLANLGIITPRSQLQKELGMHLKTEHFYVYLNPKQFTAHEAEYWAARHEFYFHEITTLLEIDWPAGRKIESYVYGSAWQKKKLSGAKFTSYVPVWLAQDQLHIAKQHLEGVLKHELVHVISKQFGNRLFNGSLSIGLIEGLAEAVSGGSSGESTLQQIVAAGDDFPAAEQLKSALSASGFYKDAASVSYTTTGAFVQYLLTRYPAHYFKEAYPKANLDKIYPVPLDSLIAGWERALVATEIDSTDKQVSEFMFSQLSLFQKKCPHKQTELQRLWDRYSFYLATRDTLNALPVIRKLHSRHPENPLILREWAQNELSAGNYESVKRTISDSDSLLTLRLLKADALQLNGEPEKAASYLAALKPALDKSSAENLRYSYALRSDSLNRHTFTEVRYSNKLPAAETFQKLNAPNRMLTAAKAAELWDAERLNEYAGILLTDSLSAEWFDMYEEMAAKLAWNKKFEYAGQLITGLRRLPLRARYTERLDELEKWVGFLRAGNS